VIIKGVDILAAILKNTINEFFPKVASDSNESGGGGMIFPSGSYKPAGPWKHAKMPAKKEPVCFESSRKFNSGQSLQSIAVAKGVMPATILSHCIDGLGHGLPCDLSRLATEAVDYMGGPPTASEWDLIESATHMISFDAIECSSAIPMKVLTPFWLGLCV
jgi:hypothetical protein